MIFSEPSADRAWRDGKKINSPHFRTLVKELRLFLENATEQSGALEAGTPIAELANKRIYKMYHRVMKRGQAIVDDSPAEHLHDLRKECKNYAILWSSFVVSIRKKDWPIDKFIEASARQSRQLSGSGSAGR